MHRHDVYFNESILSPTRRKDMTLCYFGPKYNILRFFEYTHSGIDKLVPYPCEEYWLTDTLITHNYIQKVSNIRANRPIEI